jgi:Molecular chaperone (small heat shock protein)
MLVPSILGKDMFDDFFGFPFYDDKDFKKMEKKLYGHREKNLMKTDVKESDGGYELEMDLPGFKKDDVKVALENGYLTVSAVKESEDEKESGKYIRRERYSGACQRSFYVGEDVEQEDIRGEFKHGILKLSIPKKEAKPAVEEKKYITLEG